MVIRLSLKMVGAGFPHRGKVAQNITKALLAIESCFPHFLEYLLENNFREKIPQFYFEPHHLLFFDLTIRFFKFPAVNKAKTHLKDITFVYIVLAENLKSLIVRSKKSKWCGMF